MRRLATQSRGGAVNSQRDYQTISDLRKPLCFIPTKTGDAEVTIKYEFSESEKGFLFAGLGGYLAADATVDIRIVVADGAGKVAGQVFQIEDQRYWTRAGLPWILAFGVPAAYIVKLQWKGPAQVLVWGLNCGGLPLSPSVHKRCQRIVHRFGDRGVAFVTLAKGFGLGPLIVHLSPFRNPNFQFCISFLWRLMSIAREVESIVPGNLSRLFDSTVEADHPSECEGIVLLAADDALFSAVHGMTLPRRLRHRSRRSLAISLARLLRMCAHLNIDTHSPNSFPVRPQFCGACLIVSRLPPRSRTFDS